MSNIKIKKKNEDLKWMSTAQTARMLTALMWLIGSGRGVTEQKTISTGYLL